MNNYPIHFPPYNLNSEGYSAVDPSIALPTYGAPIPPGYPYQQQIGPAYIPGSLPPPVANYQFPPPPPPPYAQIYPSVQPLLPNTVPGPPQPYPNYSVNDGLTTAPIAIPHSIASQNEHTTLNTLDLQLCPPPQYSTLDIASPPFLIPTACKNSLDAEATPIPEKTSIKVLEVCEKGSNGNNLDNTQQNHGTVHEYNPFEPKSDAKILRRAMKKLGTDERMLTEVLARRSQVQRIKIAESYRELFGKKLVKDIKSELSGPYRTAIRSLMMPRLRFLAKCLRFGVQGHANLAKPALEILSTSSNSEIREINAIYTNKFKSSLERDLKRETSGYFRILIVGLNSDVRDMNVHVNHSDVEDDVKLLKIGKVKYWVTSNSPFTNLLISRSYPHILCVFNEYEKQCNITIEEVLKKVISGTLLECLLELVTCIRSKTRYFAMRLHGSLKAHSGLDTIIRIIVSRSEIDLKLIKHEYEKLYGRSLLIDINKEISGDLMRLLLEIAQG